MKGTVVPLDSAGTKEKVKTLSPFKASKTPPFTPKENPEFTRGGTVPKIVLKLVALRPITDKPPATLRPEYCSPIFTVTFLPFNSALLYNVPSGFVKYKSIPTVPIPSKTTPPVIVAYRERSPSTDRSGVETPDKPEVHIC